MKRSPLKRFTGLKRRTPLKARSAKRELLYESRRALVARLLLERPYCEVCHEEASVHIHEVLSRARGGSILDESNCLAVGSSCHRRIHDNPKWAEAHGLLKPSWGV